MPPPGPLNQAGALPSLQDVAASGGYWLMCAGDRLYANSTSLVGSIGVLSATFGAQASAFGAGAAACPAFVAA